MDHSDISLLSNTLKHNPKMELSRNDLLKLLSCLEGELQARDVVIATLKAEKVKSLLVQARYGTLSLNSPYDALQRDSFSAVQSHIDEAALRNAAENHRAAMEALIQQQRRAQMRMSYILRDAEDRHQKVVQELEDEKQKHEHDTAQGDDITYGLERERTRLRQELELERQNKKKLEKELKKLTDTLEEERNRQKQIVLLLLAERKKIIMKYVEERKRSEDLAQILAEEKGRVDSMAEGLEEESKKSLQMEAELEKHLAQFDMEREQLRGAMGKEEVKRRDLETDIDKLRNEVDSLKRQLSEAHSVAMVQANATLNAQPCMVMQRPAVPAGGTLPPQPPNKPMTLPPQTPPRIGQPAGHMMGNVTKVVQPTATVSSVPVSGPTTGIARSVLPGQSIRMGYSPSGEPRLPGTSTLRATSSVPDQWHSPGTPSASGDSATAAGAPTPAHALRLSQSLDRNQPQVVQVTPRVSVSASPGTKVFTSTQGSKVTFHVTANASGTAVPTPLSTTPTADTTQQVPVIQPKKPTVPLGRGVPPPVPPNKPVVPPKKEIVARTIAQAPRPDTSNPETQPQQSLEAKPQKVGQNCVQVEKVQKEGGGGGADSPQVNADSARVGNGECATSPPPPSTASPAVALADTHEQAPVSLHGSLDQELANFQQVLVSMATAGPPDLASPCTAAPASSATTAAAAAAANADISAIVTLSSTASAAAPIATPSQHLCSDDESIAVPAEIPSNFKAPALASSVTPPAADGIALGGVQ